MCQGRHHPIKTGISGKLGIAYCLLGIILLFLGCARQDDAPFVSHSSESTQGSIAETETQEDIPGVIQPELVGSEPNQQPVILSTPVTIINSDETYAYPVFAIDPDGDQLALTLLESMDGLNIESGAGIIYGQNLDPGIHNIRVQVDDGRGGVSEQGYVLNVTANPTVHSNPAGSTFNSYTYRYTVLATSTDGSDLIYKLDNSPTGMLIDEITGELEWENPAIGEHNVRINVTSASGNVAHQDYVLTVLDENNLEIVSKPELIAYQSQPYRYRPSVLGITELDKTFTLVNADSEMNFEETTGIITWTPTIPGNFPVELMVMDTDGRTGTQVFEIQVRSLEEMEREFNGIIQDVFDDLVAGNIESARSLMSGEFQENYLTVLNALLPYMQEVMANMGDMKLMSINNTSAEYIIPRTSNGERRLFIVTFVPDEDGNWRLNSL